MIVARSAPKGDDLALIEDDWRIGPLPQKDLWFEVRHRAGVSLGMAIDVFPRDMMESDARHYTLPSQIVVMPLSLRKGSVVLMRNISVLEWRYTESPTKVRVADFCAIMLGKVGLIPVSMTSIFSGEYKQGLRAEVDLWKKAG